MKNASGSKESYNSSTSGTSDSSCSIESMETANNKKLDIEPAATSVPIQADDRVDKGESIHG